MPGLSSVNQARLGRGASEGGGQYVYTASQQQSCRSCIQESASSVTDRLSTTFRTPSTDCAVFSASSFSAREATLPERVTVPPSARICTDFREIAFVEYNSNSTRCASLSSALSGFVCASVAVKLSVTPCTPVTCQAMCSAWFF